MKDGLRSGRTSRAGVRLEHQLRVKMIGELRNFSRSSNVGQSIGDEKNLLQNGFKKTLRSNKRTSGWTF